MLNDAVITSSSSFDPTLYLVCNYVILADIVRGEDDLIAASSSECSSALTARTMTDLFFSQDLQHSYFIPSLGPVFYYTLV